MNELQEKVKELSIDEIKKKMEEHPNIMFQFLREKKEYQKIFNMKEMARRMGNLSYNTLHHGLSRDTQYNVKNQEIMNDVILKFLEDVIDHVLSFENPKKTNNE